MTEQELKKLTTDCPGGCGEVIANCLCKEFKRQRPEDGNWHLPKYVTKESGGNK